MDTEIILSTQTGGQLTAEQQMYMNRYVQEDYGVFPVFSNFNVRKVGNTIYVDKGLAYVNGALVENLGISFNITQTAAYYDVYIRVEYDEDMTGRAAVCVDNRSSLASWYKRNGTTDRGVYYEYQLNVVVGSNNGGYTYMNLLKPISSLEDNINSLTQSVTPLQSKVQALEYDTGWVSVPANGYNYTGPEVSYIRRVGKIVTMRLAAVTANNIADGANVQATVIPEQFRPAASLYFNNVAVGTSVAFSNFDCTVLTGGQINLRCKGGALAKGLTVQGTLTWMVD